MAHTMLRFKTKTIDEYFGSQRIIQFIEYAESHKHLLGRYDGSLTLYRKCKSIRNIDSHIAKYGQHNTYYYCTYEFAKKLIRRTLKELENWEKMNASNIFRC